MALSRGVMGLVVKLSDKDLKLRIFHEYTFCMSLLNILSKAILPIKVSSMRINS